MNPSHSTLETGSALAAADTERFHDSAMSLNDIVLEGRLVESHRPWPRAVVSEDAWIRAAALLREGRCTLLGLWGSGRLVHMALLDEGPHRRPAVLSLPCSTNRFPSVGRFHAPAIRLERAIRDVTGMEPEGAPDARPWLDHGNWTRQSPLRQGDEPPRLIERYAFLPVEGEGLHQIPVGPVHAGIIEPGHFRFTANGETIVRLEERLGYVHKGIESLMAGLPIERAALLAGRVSGDSTVAYAFAFSRAVEAALGLDIPPRAIGLRALMAELERLANHLGDIGAICNDAAFAILHAQFGLLRERVLRAADECFGHRLMMDRIAPGGVARDLRSEGAAAIATLVAQIRKQFPELVELYDNTASLQDRTVGTGILSRALARQFGCGGYVGRASGRRFDCRQLPGYAPYDGLKFEVPVLEDGDVDARVWIRVREVEQSLSIIDQILRELPEGSIRNPLPPPGAHGAREGIALTESFRGDVLVSVQVAPDGTVTGCHLRDPSWFQWPLLEVVVEGNIVADFPLCNKSFNCSYSGHDL